MTNDYNWHINEKLLNLMILDILTCNKWLCSPLFTRNIAIEDRFYECKKRGKCNYSSIKNIYVKRRIYNFIEFTWHIMLLLSQRVLYNFSFLLCNWKFVVSIYFFQVSLSFFTVVYKSNNSSLLLRCSKFSSESV